jgi:type VI secretion system protein ImpL
MDPALQRLRDIPGIHRDVAPYRVPWYLLAGTAGAAEALLRAAHQGSDRAGPPGLPAGDGWGWWLLPKMVGIALGDALVRPKEADPEGWLVLETALSLLLDQRKRLPLNGLVAAVPVEVLADAAQARSAGGVVRGLIAEACRALRLDLPVHIIVTGIERLPGHAGFFAALPARIGDQAIGHLHDPYGAVPDPHSVVGGAFAAMVARLEAVRLGLLLDLTAEQDRAAIFRFVEAVAGLQEGIEAYARALLVQDAYSAAPCWRGLFLTAPESTAAGTRHVADLFSRFLPQDAGLLAPR